MSQDKPLDQVKAYADIMKGVTATGHCEPLVFALLSFLIFGQQAPGVRITWYGPEDLDCKENLHIAGETTGLSKALEKREAWHKELEEWGDRVLVAPDGFMVVNPRIPLHVVPRIEEILQIKVHRDIFNLIDGQANFALGHEPREERKARSFHVRYGRQVGGVKFDDEYITRLLNAKQSVFDDLITAPLGDMAWASSQNRLSLKHLGAAFLFRDGYFDELYVPSIEQKRWQEILKDGEFQMGVDLAGKEPPFFYVTVVPKGSGLEGMIPPGARIDGISLSGPGNPNGTQTEGTRSMAWGSPGVFDAIRAGAEDKGEDYVPGGRGVDGGRMARCREDINEFIAYMRKSKRPANGPAWQALIDSHRRVVIAPERGDGLTSELLYRIIFELGRNPQLRIRLLCASDPVALEKIGWIRTYIESEQFRDVFPGIEIDPDAAAYGANNVYLKNRLTAGIPTVQGVRVLATWAGHRVDLLVCDSVVIEPNSKTVEEQQTVFHALRDTWFSLIAPNGRIILGNTPLHREDALHKLVYYGQFETWWDKTQWFGEYRPLGAGISSVAWGTDAVRKALGNCELYRTRRRVAELIIHGPDTASADTAPKPKESTLFEKAAAQVGPKDTLHYGSAAYRVDRVRRIAGGVTTGIWLVGSDREFKLDDLLESMMDGTLDAINRTGYWLWSRRDLFPRMNGIEFTLQEGDVLIYCDGRRGTVTEATPAVINTGPHSWMSTHMLDLQCEKGIITAIVRPVAGMDNHVLWESNK